jgi:hypothetical protein
VTWYEKDAVSDDAVWIQILDGALAPVTVPMLVATKSLKPRVASDGTDYWIAWVSYESGTDKLVAVRVTAAGAVNPRAVETSGGTPVHWDMVARQGQAVLAWTEAGGVGPDLWFEAMCL